MGYGQFLGEFGGTVQPIVMREQFNEVLRFRGQPIKLLHGPTSINCPCVNPAYQEPDPDCDVCNGTGNVSGWTLERTFLAIVFIDAEMRQDQHQKLETRAGGIQTLDGRMYCEGRWNNYIHIGDIIIYKEPMNTEGIEMQIISKSPRMGNTGEIIFLRCELERQPTRQVTNATDIRNLP